MKKPFYKMHGLGNDFVIIDETNNSFFDPIDIPKLSNRHTGIGFDQLLLIRKSNDELYEFKIFNADGSEAEQCGNGLRCVARFLFDNYYSSQKSFSIKTKAGIFSVVIQDNNLVKVNLGLPNFAYENIPVLKPQLDTLIASLPKEIKFLDCLSFGNPHIIFQTDTLNTLDIATLGQTISQNAAFPKGINVGFLQVLNPHAASLRTFERGAGLTLACGSNTCAAAIVGVKQGILTSPVEIQLAMGSLHIEWANQRDTVLMTGPAEYVFKGELD